MDFKYCLNSLCIFLLYVSTVVVLAVHISEYGKDSPDARLIRYLPSVEIFGLGVVHLKVPECKKISYIRVIVHNHTGTPLVTFEEKTKDVTIDSGSPGLKIKAEIIVKGHLIPTCKPSHARPINVLLPHTPYKQILSKSNRKKKVKYKDQPPPTSYYDEFIDYYYYY